MGILLEPTHLHTQPGARYANLAPSSQRSRRTLHIGGHIVGHGALLVDGSRGTRDVFADMA